MAPAKKVDTRYACYLDENGCFRSATLYSLYQKQDGDTVVVEEVLPSDLTGDKWNRWKHTGNPTTPWELVDVSTGNDGTEEVVTNEI